MNVYGIGWLNSSTGREGDVPAPLQAHRVITFLFQIHCDLV